MRTKGEVFSKELRRGELLILKLNRQENDFIDFECLKASFCIHLNKGVVRLVPTTQS